MADERNKFFGVLGSQIHYLRLFSVDVPIPKDDTTNENPKKQSLIKTKPIFFDDDHRHKYKTMLKRHKTNHHENNLDVINAELVGWLDPAASTPLVHQFVLVDPGLVLWNFINTTLGGKKIELIIEKLLEKTNLDGHQAQLSMPNSHIMREFLTKQEEDLLEDQEKLPIIVIDPCVRPFELKLAKCKYHKKTNKNVNNEGHSGDQSRRSCS